MVALDGARVRRQRACRLNKSARAGLELAEAEKVGVRFVVAKAGCVVGWTAQEELGEEKERCAVELHDGENE